MTLFVGNLDLNESIPNFESVMKMQMQTQDKQLQQLTLDCQDGNLEFFIAGFCRRIKTTRSFSLQGLVDKLERRLEFLIVGLWNCLQFFILGVEAAWSFLSQDLVCLRFYIRELKCLRSFLLGFEIPKVFHLGIELSQVFHLGF